MDGLIYGEFLVDEDLLDVSGASIDKVIVELAELKAINDKIVKLLSDSRWDGDAHDKCVAAIDTMEQYREKLDNMCGTLKYNISNIVTNAGEFADNSDKVASIRKV